jgi:hypothetical protein
VTIGIGNAERIDSLDVVWPGGVSQKCALPPLGRETLITEARIAPR